VKSSAGASAPRLLLDPNWHGTSGRANLSGTGIFGASTTRLHNPSHNHLSETGPDGPTLLVAVSPRLHSLLRRRISLATSCQGGRRGFDSRLPLRKGPVFTGPFAFLGSDSLLAGDSITSSITGNGGRADLRPDLVRPGPPSLRVVRTLRMSYRPRYRARAACSSRFGVSYMMLLSLPSPSSTGGDRSVKIGHFLRCPCGATCHRRRLCNGTRIAERKRMTLQQEWRRASVLAVSLCFFAIGCTNPGVCAGAATCFAAEAARCEHVPGCSPTPGCLTSPLGGDDCASLPTEAACARATHCFWANGRCNDPCASVADQATCSATPSCLWSACTGTPKECRIYSSDQCPISPLGCYLDPGN
jgi:hypothetical protein